MTVDWCGPTWLRPLFEGQEDSIFHRVTELAVVERVVPDDIVDLRHLKSVNLSGAKVSEKAYHALNRVETFVRNRVYVYQENQRYATALDFAPVWHPPSWKWDEYLVALPSLDWNQEKLWANVACEKDPDSDTLVNFTGPTQGISENRTTDSKENVRELPVDP